MALGDTLGKKIKSAADAVRQGNKQSEQLGTELGEARKMREAGKQAYDEMTNPKPAAPAAAPSTSPKDRINPGAKYGDRPGEKRIDVDKPIASMKKGGKVKKTGLYRLHSGEAVLKKEDAEKLSSRGADALGNGKSAGKAKKGSGRVPHKMISEMMDDGSFQITHEHRPDSPEQPAPKAEKFTAANSKHLVRHVRNTYSGGEGEE